MNTEALSIYRDTLTSSAVIGASSHKLIELLLDSAIDRIAKAKGHMGRQEYGPQGELIGKVIDIVSSLDSYLDLNQGGDVARNLQSLYDYIVRKLFAANANKNLEELEEARQLLVEIRSGWLGISDEVAR